MTRDEVERLVRGEHHEPHRLLGAHTENDRTVIRTFRPDATAVVALVPERSGEPQGGAPVDRVQRVKLEQVHPAGLFEGTVDGKAPPAYRLEVSYPTGSFTIDDPYRFWPTIGELDQYLLGEGRHERLWQKLGAHELTVDGVAGTAFAVWAPNARAVRVVGDFNSWDGRLNPGARLVGDLGAVRPRGRRRVPVQVRAGHPVGVAHPQGRPGGVLGRGAAQDGQRRLHLRLHLGR